MTYRQLLLICLFQKKLSHWRQLADLDKNVEYLQKYLALLWVTSSRFRGLVLRSNQLGDEQKDGQSMDAFLPKPDDEIGNAELLVAMYAILTNHEAIVFGKPLGKVNHNQLGLPGKLAADELSPKRGFKSLWTHVMQLVKCVYADSQQNDLDSLSREDTMTIAIAMFKDTSLANKDRKVEKDRDPKFIQEWRREAEILDVFKMYTQDSNVSQKENAKMRILSTVEGLYARLAPVSPEKSVLAKSQWMTIKRSSLLLEHDAAEHLFDQLDRAALELGADRALDSVSTIVDEWLFPELVNRLMYSGKVALYHEFEVLISIAGYADARSRGELLATMAELHTNFYSKFGRYIQQLSPSKDSNLTDKRQPSSYFAKDPAEKDESDWIVPGALPQLPEALK
ncbi:hypothetical protein [Lacticaseibacillus absianus]|uniref:hypothetical protein n=1 Tax=Lacticaseibacillus absianus TaxID=2729623 RepID=UPI0015C874AB|nr:hypothetical protein [Lacticaseibacillus absianus]